MSKVLPSSKKKFGYGINLAFPDTWFDCYRCGANYIGVYPHSLFYCRFCRWLEKND